MKTTSYLCAAAMLAAGGAAFTLPANAANATQQACSSQYQAAKTAGTLNGQKWSDFYSSCAAAMKSGAAPTAVIAPASTAKPAAQPRMAATRAAPAARGQSAQQLCSTQYQAAKTAGTLNGQKWPAFYSSCAASIKNYQEPAAAPALPTVAAAPAARGNATNAQSNYQPPANLSAGEAAFQQRIHACAAEWQSEKSAGALPAGSKWPQFWSACNTQLKQQG